VSTVRLPWGTAGLVAGAAGFGVAYGSSQFLGRRLTPFDAVAELVIDLTPGSFSHWFIERFGTSDKFVLGLIIAVLTVALLFAAGRLAAAAWWAPLPVYAALGGLAAVAALTRDDSALDDGRRRTTTST
jgi:uncharacterized membrane protein YjdF